jgi:thiamine kinase-like enzyme
VTNIFYSEDNIRLIDWDTSGWGYLGEDIASLIADEADVENMIEIYNRCVKAYHKGFSENADMPYIKDHCIWEMILLMYGYRMVEWFKFAETPEEKAHHMKTMEKIYEIKYKK